LTILLKTVIIGFELSLILKKARQDCFRKFLRNLNI